MAVRKEEVKKLNRKLMDFLDHSVNAFFAVENMREILLKEGFHPLYEGEDWQLESGEKYFVTRNDSALIAFVLPKKPIKGFQMMASHSDSPVFKVKTDPEIEVDKAYIQLNVEKYGGMICSPWLDRPLSVAGRVLLRTSKGVETRLLNIDRDLLIIPNLAIHMNREVNDGYKFNAQKDMLPLFSTEEGKGGFRKIVAEALSVKEECILDWDLFLYNRQKATFLGAEEEFIGSGRLDDLQCAFASLQGILSAKPKDSVAVHCVYDNEEVGSGTKQGAGSTFLKDVLHRILAAFQGGEEEFIKALQNSFLISADNAHAVHPSHLDKADPVNRPYMNRGIVLKYSANQKYTTDAVSGAVFKSFCEKAKVPFQCFTNRSDMLGGSTLGNISNSQVALNTVDIGLAQLSMHSPFETAGVLDSYYLVEVAKLFYSSSILGRGDGKLEIRF
jgi:M18 family aminopeptidase